MYVFGTTKPSRLIWNYFVNKIFHDQHCYLVIMLYAGIFLYFLAFPDISTDWMHCAGGGGGALRVSNCTRRHVVD